MTLLEWFRNLGRPSGTDSISVPVKLLTKEYSRSTAQERMLIAESIRSIEIRLNLIEDEAEVIYRR